MKLFLSLLFLTVVCQEIFGTSLQQNRETCECESQSEDVAGWKIKYCWYHEMSYNFQSTSMRKCMKNELIKANNTNNRLVFFTVDFDDLDMYVTGLIRGRYFGLKSLSLLKVYTTFGLFNAMLKGLPSTLISLCIGDLQLNGDLKEEIHDFSAKLPQLTSLRFLSKGSISDTKIFESLAKVKSLRFVSVSSIETLKWILTLSTGIKLPWTELELENCNLEELSPSEFDNFNNFREIRKIFLNNSLSEKSFDSFMDLIFDFEVLKVEIKQSDRFIPTPVFGYVYEKWCFFESLSRKLLKENVLLQLFYDYSEGTKAVFWLQEERRKIILSFPEIEDSYFVRDRENSIKSISIIFEPNYLSFYRFYDYNDHLFNTQFAIVAEKYEETCEMPRFDLIDAQSNLEILKLHEKEFTKLAMKYFNFIYSTSHIEIITAEIGEQHTSEPVVHAELEKSFNHDMQNGIDLTENMHIDQPYKVDEKTIMESEDEDDFVMISDSDLIDS